MSGGHLAHQCLIIGYCSCKDDWHPVTPALSDYLMIATIRYPPSSCLSTCTRSPIAGTGRSGLIMGLGFSNCPSGPSTCALRCWALTILIMPVIAPGGGVILEPSSGLGGALPRAFIALAAAGRRPAGWLPQFLAAAAW